MAVQNTHRSYLGIAKEATKGTAVQPTDFIPVTASKLKPVDVIGELYDKGLRGSLIENYNYIPGRKYSTFDFGGPVFADTFGYVLGGILGDVDTTGLSAPYTHTFGIKGSTGTGSDAQPTAFTLTDFYAADVRNYPGCQVHDVTLSFTSDGLLDYDAKATGYASSTTTEPSPSFSDVLPTPTWVGLVTIGGSLVSNSVEGNISMTRPVTPIFGISATQNPYSVFLGALETKGTIRFVMEDDTELIRFITNTQPSININWSQGSGVDLVIIEANITKGAYTAAVIDRSKDYVEIEVTLNAQGNTTDVVNTSTYGNITWILQNQKASGTYQ